MPAGPFTAGSVMDMAASLLNDTAKSIYTYVAQLPYLKMSIDELQMELQLNNVPVTNVTSQIIPVNVGDIQIGPTNGAPPTYAGDLVAIQQLWERAQDSTDQWMPLTQLDFITPISERLPASTLMIWSWQENIIKFPIAGCSSAREVKIDYIADAIAEPTDAQSPIGVINSKNFLGYRTASLCAKYIKRDKDVAADMDNGAQMAIDQLIGIETKGRQSITTRKRPFRASYRGRGLW